MNVSGHFFQPKWFKREILSTLSSHKTAILIVAAAAFCCLALLFWAVGKNHYKAAKPLQQGSSASETDLQKKKKSVPETPVVNNKTQQSFNVPKSDATNGKNSFEQPSASDSMNQLIGGTKPETGGLFRLVNQKPQTNVHKQFTGQYAYQSLTNGQNISIKGDDVNGISVHINGSLIEKIDYQTFMQNGYRRKLNGVDINIPNQGQKIAKTVQKSNKQPQNTPIFPIGII